MTVSHVERVDLARVDAGRVGKPCVFDHLRRGARLDAHRAHRHRARELIGGNGEHALVLGGGERVSLAASAATDIHADTRVPDAAEVSAQRLLVELAVVVERSDAHGEGRTRMVHLRILPSCARLHRPRSIN